MRTLLECLLLLATVEDASARVIQAEVVQPGTRLAPSLVPWRGVPAAGVRRVADRAVVALAREDDSEVLWDEEVENMEMLQQLAEADKRIQAVRDIVSDAEAEALFDQRALSEEAWRKTMAVREAASTDAQRSLSEEAASVLEADGDARPPAMSTARRADLEKRLLSLAAATNRGASARAADRDEVAAVLDELERSIPAGIDVESGDLDGSWRLVYASCPAYRSSPFFWAFGELQPAAAGLLYNITDGLPFYRVGSARQTLQDTGRNGKLVSEVEVDVFVFDALLPPVRGVVTTTASTRPDDSDPSALEVVVETTEVKESTLPFTDLVTFPSKEAFAALSAVPGDATPARMRTTYLSPSLRVSRTPRDVLVYVPLS